MKRLLITGASGFIGKALFTRLESLNPIGIYFRTKPQLDDINMVSADLRKDDTVYRLLDEYQPEAIFHLAALISPQANENNPALATESNLRITENILKYSARLTHIIFLSTDKVFDGTAPYPDETTSPRPVGLYGLLKRQCEQLIQSQAKRHHIFRLPIVHGLGDPSSLSFVDKALIELRNAQTVEAFDNVRRCFVKLEDLIEILTVTLQDTNYGLYHVGSPMLSYYDRLRVLCEDYRVAWKGKLRPKAGQAVPLEQNFDTQKITSVFGCTFC